MKKFIWPSKVNKTKTQRRTPDVFLLLHLSVTLIVLSCVACGLNTWIYHYPGNNYFPPFTGFTGLTLCILHVGVRLMYGSSSTECRFSEELLLFLSIMVILAFATNAVQYTPFQPIDNVILNWETVFPWSIETMLRMTHRHPFFKEILKINYASLDYQMAFLPIVVMISKQYHVLHRYYQYLLFTTLLGFTCYYFFPTTAPASLLNLPYFSDAQYATGLKFTQIHHHLTPTTIEGGLIAFPSFHAIWAILCVLLVKNIRFLFLPLLLNNTLLILSCVLLGWHYILDIIASFGLVLLSYAASIWFNTWANRQPASANCDSEMTMARR